MAAPAAAAAAAAAAPGSKGEAKISPAKGENLNTTKEAKKETGKKQKTNVLLNRTHLVDISKETTNALFVK